MDRFRELSAFVAVAETRAFNGAARRLGLSAPAVTRLVTALEGRLGVRLLARTTRQVAPTEAGARLLADMQPLLAAIEAAEAAAAGAHAEPLGRLRVTAPVLFGEMFVAPILRDWLDRWPRASAQLLLLDRVADLIDEGIDVAVRIGELPDSSLAAARVGAVRRVVVAAPGFVAAQGAPDAPEDLARFRLVAGSGLAAGGSWAFSAGGVARAVRIAPALEASGVRAALAAAEAGWGITRALSYQAAEALASGALVELLADWEDRSVPVHLVHAEGRRASAKVRSFVDAAAAALRADPRLAAAAARPGGALSRSGWRRAAPRRA